MRFFKQYLFYIGTKIPFAQWPELVRSFLEGQQLQYDRFSYYFETIGDGCARASGENPELGKVQIKKSKSGTVAAYLTNLGGNPGCSEAELMRILPKLCHRYGMDEISLQYHGVDFLSRKSISANPDALPTEDTFESRIRLNRFPSFASHWSSIEFMMEIMNEEDIAWADQYRDYFVGLLPKHQRAEAVLTELGEDEKNEYIRLKTDVRPLVEQAGRMFAEQMEQVKKSTGEEQKSSPAVMLKRLSQKYDIEYIKHHCGCYVLQKQTYNGHWISIEIDTGRSRNEWNSAVELKGPGFDHRIYCDSKDQSVSLEAYLDHFFATLSYVEEHCLREICAFYPETPKWFVYA